MQKPVTSAQILEQTLQHIAPLPSQQGYAQALASIFSMHIHRNELIDDGLSPDDLPVASAVVVAPTGQGKTYLFRKMAECVGLNAIIIDCSALAAEGWKGISLSQRLAAAMEEADDEQSFVRSVLLMDEFDKLRFWGSSSDQGNAMTNLLQLFNGGTVAVEVKKETKHVDVSRFTVIFGGAFAGLDEVIRDRVCPKVRIGFDSEPGEKLSKAELLQLATNEDLAKYGMMPELLGRIGSILSIPPLGVEDYRQLLNAENGSIHKRYRNYLNHLFGVDFEIAQSGVEVIARRCLQADTGARAATPIVNDRMRSALAAVEAEPSICKVILDADADGCFIRYEHGQRAYAYRSPARAQALEELPWHTVKAGNIQALSRKLLRYYRNAEGKLDLLPQLEAFLGCTLKYLFEKVRPNERTFDSLEQLARATRREGRRSAYDIIMGDAHCLFSDEYQAFDKAYTSWMQRNLISALHTIMVYLQERHGDCRVRFELIDPQKPPKTDAQ